MHTFIFAEISWRLFA